MPIDLLLPGTDEVTRPDRATPQLAALRRALSDVWLFHTSDGGEIECLNGIVTLADGLETVVYLSMFGGNEDDGGLTADEPVQWWGNIGEGDPSRIMRSETQHLLRNIPAVPANLRRLEDAANRDLSWMVGTVATFVSVLVTMPGLNRVRFDINAEAQDTVYPFSFTEHWGTAR